MVPALRLAAAALVYALAGTALALGRVPRLAAAALVGSMIPTTLAGHSYWTHDDPAARAQQRIQFHKNLAMIGGLLLAVLDDPTRERPPAPKRTGQTESAA